MKRAIYLLAVLLVLIVSVPFCAQWYADYMKKKHFEESERSAHDLALAMIQYAQDHKDRWPDGLHWESEVMPYLRPRASDPPFDLAIPSHPGDRWAMNVAFSGKSVNGGSIPYTTPLLYEISSRAPNASGTPPWPAWYKCGPNVKGWRMAVFQDGWTAACSTHNYYLQ